MAKSRRMKLAGHTARIREKLNTYKLLVLKPERKISLGTTRRRLVDNIKVDVRYIGWGGMDWIDVSFGGEG
jgi:hypothetical protein